MLTPACQIGMASIAPCSSIHFLLPLAMVFFSKAFWIQQVERASADPLSGNTGACTSHEHERFKFALPLQQSMDIAMQNLHSQLPLRLSWFAHAFACLLLVVGNLDRVATRCAHANTRMRTTPWYVHIGKPYQTLANVGDTINRRDDSCCRTL